MYTEPLDTLEASIKEAKAATELGKSLDRLMLNRDFRQVISEGYFEKEAIRLVMAKSLDENKDEASQRSILLQIDAIGSLSKYLRGIAASAALAAKTVEVDEETREELINEGR